MVKTITGFIPHSTYQNILNGVFQVKDSREFFSKIIENDIQKNHNREAWRMGYVETGKVNVVITPDGINYSYQFEGD